MATYTWHQEFTNFVCSYDESEIAIKDQIRGLIGDINGTPVAFLSDESIEATAALHSDNLYTAASECARKCSARCLSILEQVRQGTRFEIKTFDPAVAYQKFIEMANELANRSLPANTVNYGALSGQIVAPCPPASRLPQPLWSEW